MTQHTTLSVGTKLGYGVGSIGEGLAYNAFYLYFIYFLTDYVGIDPVVAGSISLFAVIWDAVTDPMIGYFSDRIQNPNGKRRSFMLKGFIPLGAVIFLLFSDWEFLSGGMQVAYFVIVNTLFWFFFTAVDIPYMTLGGELSEKEEDRLSIRSFGTAGYYIGFLFASSGVVLLQEKFAEILNGDQTRAWTYVGLVVGVIVALTYFICICAVKGKEITAPASEEEKKNEIGFLDSVKAIFTIKPYWHILGYDFFCNLGIMFWTTGQLYIFESYVGMSSGEIAFAFAAYVAFIVVLSQIYPRLVSDKHDKKVLLALTLTIAAVLQAVYIFIPLTFSGIIVILFSNALTMTGFYTYSYALLFEIGEVAVLKTKHKLEGMFMSGYQFVYKFGTAVSMWLFGIALDYFQYDAAAETLSEFTLGGLRAIASWMPGLMLLCGVPSLLMYKLSKGKVDQLKAVLERAQKGEPVSEDEYKGIL